MNSTKNNIACSGDFLEIRDPYYHGNKNITIATLCGLRHQTDTADVYTSYANVLEVRFVAKRHTSKNKYDGYQLTYSVVKGK